MASPDSIPPPILSNPRRTPPWLRKGLAISVALGLSLLVAGIFLRTIPALSWLGGAMILAGFLVAAGGLWGSYYSGPY